MTDERGNRSRSASDRRECEREKGHAKRHGCIVPLLAGVAYVLLASATGKPLAMRRHDP